MYRRVSSDRFMVLTTAAIVVVMAVFTWVMWGMAQQVFEVMTTDIHSMAANIDDMTANIDDMGNTIAAMEGDISTMADSIPAITESMLRMTSSIDRMTQDVGRASYAFTQPMSYMWGNPFPF